MSTEKTILAIVVASALSHNGKYYAVGDEIEVTESEYKRLQSYLTLKDNHSFEQAQREAQAKAHALAQQAEQEQQALEQEQQALKQALTDVQNKLTQVEAALADVEMERDQLKKELETLKEGGKKSGRAKKKESSGV